MNSFEIVNRKIRRPHKDSSSWWPRPKELGLGKDFSNIKGGDGSN
ncbi:MAG: hypothetical protein ACFFE4_22340 [Candidatus Thorarchaeota archaeon]